MQTISLSGSGSHSSLPKKLFGRERSLYAVFGGGRVADVVFWKNKNLSVGILVVVTIIWWLLEVVEYPFLTLMCHAFIIAMLLLFISYNGAALIKRDPPNLSDSFEPAIKDFAQAFQYQLTWLAHSLHYLACGKDLKLFLLAIFSLWILSIFGNYCSSLSLLYTCLLCMQTLPILYETYENEVDDLVRKGIRDIKESYKNLVSYMLEKLPSAQVKVE